MAIELLAIPLLDVKGTPLHVLDVLAAASTIVSLLILAGKRIFKTGILSDAIDKLIEWVGPITSGVEQILTRVSATTTFVSISVHVAQGDYGK